MTSLPPDVQRKTRLVALCFAEVANILDKLDTWMLADYLLFFHFFHKMGLASETWIMPQMDITELLRSERDGVLLHGSPYYKRKVVLDAQLWDAMKNFHKQIPYAQLKAQFLEILKQECETAKKNNEKVLILMFGHGGLEFFGGGPDIAYFTFGEDYLDIKSFVRALLRKKPRSFLREPDDLDVDITLVTMACYSGQFLVQKNLNLTGFAACDPERLNSSWRYSGSTGRASGSMYASAIARRLVKGCVAESPEEHETMRGLQEGILTALYDIDKTAHMRKPVFKAKDDRWGDPWDLRTGIPLANCSARWDNLRDYDRDSSLHVGDPLNRDPHVPQIYRDQFHVCQVQTRSVIPCCTTTCV